MTVGVFDHEERAKQLIRFDGMHMGKRGFTDFDAVMEWRKRGWLVFEVKCIGKEIPIGQKLALERFVRDTSATGKFSVAALVEHNVTNPAEPIYLRDCLVKSVYVTDEFTWRPPKEWMNSHGLMSKFIEVVDKKLNDGPSGPSHIYRW